MGSLSFSKGAVKYGKITYLENTIKDKNNKLEKLEKSINNANIIFKSTEIILEFEGYEIDRNITDYDKS